MPTSRSTAVRPTTPFAQALEESPYSGAGLARKMKVGEAQVSRWKNGLYPDKDNRQKAARYLEVDVEELFPGA